MYDKDLKGISFTAGFFMLIAFAIAGLFIAGEVIKPVWVAMTGAEYSTMQTSMTNPAFSNAHKVIQAITAILGLFIPTVVTAYFLHRKPFKLIGFTKGTQINQVGAAILILGASVMVASSLSYITNLIPLPNSWKIHFDKMENEYSTQINAIMNLKSRTDYVIALVVMAFLPAVCEETLFRGGLQNFLSRGSKKPWMAIIIASILFSLAHFSYYGFLSRFFLGVILGAMYHYSGKIWLSMLGHFLYNAFLISLLYYYQQQGKGAEDAMREGPNTIWGILGLPIVISLFLFLRRVSFNRRMA